MYCNDSDDAMTKIIDNHTRKTIEKFIYIFISIQLINIVYYDHGDDY